VEGIFRRGIGTSSVTITIKEGVYRGDGAKGKGRLGETGVSGRHRKKHHSHQNANRGNRQGDLLSLGVPGQKKSRAEEGSVSQSK